MPKSLLLALPLYPPCPLERAERGGPPIHVWLAAAYAREGSVMMAKLLRPHVLWRIASTIVPWVAFMTVLIYLLR
jgi:hypothetical protein